MKVPGLSGTWQQRNAKLYKTLGAPLGGYTGSYAQNVWLQNQLKKNNYFGKGLPGQNMKSAQAKKSGNVLDKFVDPVTGKVEVDNRVYSQDVMPLDQWRGTFDAWTQNFVDTYIRPEWEQNTYNPAMKTMTRDMNEVNQNMGNSGQWRTSGARNNLHDMATEALDAEQKMKREFNDQSVGIRDSMNEALADPLYKANMERFVTAPWRDMNIGNEINNAAKNIDSTAWDAFKQSMKDKGINYEAALNPADAIDNIAGWEPNKPPSATMRDWKVNPNQYGNLGTNLYSQYLRGNKKYGSGQNTLGNQYQGWY